MDNQCNNNFDLSCNNLSERIAVIFPAVQNGRHQFRTASSVHGNRGNNMSNQV